MKYSIFYLIKGKAGKYNQKLVREVGPKFGEKYLIENPLPSHITLKYPFETDNAKEIEKLLQEFVKRQKQSSIEINGFENFRKFVVLLRVIFSKEALNTQKQLLYELKKIGIESNEFDIKFKPHATIAYGNTKESFDGIWNYIGKLEEPVFELKFDNIALMKKSGKYWKVHKEFNIK